MIHKKSNFRLTWYILFLLSFSLTAWSATENTVTPPKVGESAPDFELLDSNGKKHQLSKYIKAGNYVVLEWINHECPFVKKHYSLDKKYENHNMQATQKYAKEKKDKKVIWLSINSTHESQADFKDALKTNELIRTNKSQAHAVLIDSKSEVGQRYGAMTTPHMFVINPKGKIIYMGAIDSESSSKPEKLLEAKNYVRAALDDKIEESFVKAYGCGVKYPIKK